MALAPAYIFTVAQLLRWRNRDSCNIKQLWRSN